MKKIMSLVLILALVLSLGACGSKEAAPSADSGDKTAAQEPVELEFIQWWTTEGGGEFLEDLVKRFEEANPGITVKLTSMPFGEIRTQVVASQATGMTPDLIGMNPPWTREFYDMGILAPLDDLMAADPFFKKDNYFQASFTPIEGHTYLAPVNSMAFFLFYNKTMFKEAGIEPPTTWDELVEAAKALTVPEKNQYGITMSMSEQEASNGAILSLYPLLYAQNGRTLVDGKYTVETEGMENAMKLLETLSKNGSILPGTTTRSEFQIIEEFAAGNVGMVISHNGHINTVTNRDPNLEFGIVPLPSVDGKGTVELRHHGWDIGIAANSQHKEEAWKFISFLLNAENVEAMCNEMLKVPAMYGISVNYLDKYPVVKDAIDYMNEYEMVEELMAMPKSATCWVELTKAGSAVIQGTKTTEEALPEVQEAWNRILGQ
jgi:multiple sugar transport system substrate-binding protein